MIEVVGGVVVMIAWAGFVLWGLTEMVFAEARGNHQHTSPVLCLIAGAALGAGVVLFFKHEVFPHDTFGLASVLLLAAGFCIWVWGYSIRHPGAFRGPHAR
jgi:hypothetical protein